MADLNELNEKVEQIKADIREQLEKIDLYFVIIHVDCLVIHTYFFLFFLLLYSFFFYDAQRVLVSNAPDLLCINMTVKPFECLCDLRRSVI